MSAGDSMGRSSCGPSPLMKSNGSPMGSRGSSRSENRMAASTSIRRTGWSVTSVASSGARQMSSREYRSRSARYSAMYRPACRMNHTGVASTCSRRQALRKRDSVTDVLQRKDIRSKPATNERRICVGCRHAFGAHDIRMAVVPAVKDTAHCGAAPITRQGAWGISCYIHPRLHTFERSV